MADSTGTPFDYPIPPASFTFLVESILMQTQMQLGLLRFGGESQEEEEEDSEPNLPLARHSIDMLAMLQEKTRRNLSAEEQRILDNGLTELRFRFVQVAKELEQAATALEQPAPDSSPLIITADGGKGTKSE